MSENMTKEQLNAVIAALDKYARNYDVYEYGLPTHDEPNMAAMREVICECLVAPERGDDK